MGSGPRALVFLHGWGGNSEYWDELLGHLDLTGHRAILIDYRGHGRSGNATTAFDHERFTKDVLAVADHAKAERFVLVGFSMAGKFAQHVAATRPKRVIAQILVAPCPAGEMPLPPELGAQWLASAANPKQMRELLMPFLKIPPREELIQKYLQAIAATPNDVLRATLEMFAWTSIADIAAKVTCPTIAILGTADPMLPIDYVKQAVIGLIPGSRLALIDCGHETPMEMPATTAALIEAFLAGLSRN